MSKRILYRKNHQTQWTVPVENGGAKRVVAQSSVPLTDHETVILTVASHRPMEMLD